MILVCPAPPSSLSRASASAAASSAARSATICFQLLSTNHSKPCIRTVITILPIDLTYPVARRLRSLPRTPPTLPCFAVKSPQGVSARPFRPMLGVGKLRRGTVVFYALCFLFLSAKLLGRLLSPLPLCLLPS